MKKYRILVTGSSGAIGSCIIPELISAGHYVRGFDLRNSQNTEDIFIGDLRDLSAIEEAMKTTDTLIHLGAEPNDCDFLSRLLPSNIVGLYNVLETARKFSLRRVILASSMQVYEGILKKKDSQELLGNETAPLNHYALTKVFAEKAGQMYAQKYNLSVIAVRIGWFVRNKYEAKQMAKYKKSQDFYFSARDCARFFLKAVEAENIDFCILNAVSKPKTRALFDMEPAKNFIGYEPMDIFPQGLNF